MQDFLDFTGITYNEKSMLLDISAIPLIEEKFTDDLINQQLILLRSQEIVKEPDNDKQLTNSAISLKKKVIASLEKYSQMLINKDNSIRQVIKQDLMLINSEYQVLMNMVDQGEKVSDEVQQIVKLLGEFMEQMTIKSNEKKDIQYSKTFSDQQQIYKNHTESQQINSYESFQKQRSLPIKLYQKQSNNSFESDENSQCYQQQNIKINYNIEIQLRLLSDDKFGYNNDTFRRLRQLSKQYEDPEVKKLVKVCYLKQLAQEQSQTNTSKREFYDLVIKIKSQIPENNKIHKMMISSLYDEVVKKGVPNSEWEQYMKQLYN
ncbi:unnamed protein product (macronuclear) [Paramecium tetraurelia]|uniref:Uncharacterized protein n=1 Tax=Paramecium tetraurelia TaxID=5888 RepID=A0DTL6_PARTE|nr:uncharacterized protein GSPATT00020064001 [Paramecium tetraurelia]CAK86383.1 unnamed protein product [Paramecium tetraurelia]|eukprot:XP_001453780.1 hypothetical protein (macronuclear) [Paramecium tetraurelia strain d4-2]